MPDPDHLLPWPLSDRSDSSPDGADARSEHRGAALREALVAAYDDDTRVYHDLRHLREVLAALDELAAHGPAFDVATVRLAAWFHDAVYDGERDAEERSAAWAEDALVDLVTPTTRAEVARLVRMTETHDPDTDDTGACALSDADLAILAAAPERYAEYVAAVRREYAHVGDDDFARGRSTVLQDLLARDRLFRTEWAGRQWEQRARTNVQDELERLGRGVAALQD